jgi:uncharacterized protein YjiS (DUF1127 family)
MIRNSSSAAMPFARLVSALVGAAKLRLRQLTRAYRHRNDAAVLAGLDDRMLADMGLTRSDVRDAFAAPLWEDPTNLLRARALERRLSRHRISLGFKDRDGEAPPLVPDETWRRPRTDRPARLAV